MFDIHRSHHIDTDIHTVTLEDAREVLDTMLESNGRCVRNWWVSRDACAPAGIDQRSRRLTVGWIFAICARIKLSVRIFELAVQCLDDYIYYRRGQISQARVQCLASACIRLAAKFEESPERVPSIDTLIAHGDYQFGRRELSCVEWEVGCTTGFSSLGAVTPMDFVDFFLTLSASSCPVCSASNRSLSNQINTRTSMLRLMAQYYCTSALVDCATLRQSDDPHSGFSASVIAGAALSIARTTLGLPSCCSALQEFWSQHQEPHQMAACAAAIIRHEINYVPVNGDGSLLAIRTIFDYEARNTIGWFDAHIPAPPRSPDFTGSSCRPPISSGESPVADMDTEEDGCACLIVGGTPVVPYTSTAFIFTPIASVTSF